MTDNSKTQQHRFYKSTIAIIMVILSFLLIFIYENTSFFKGESTNFSDKPITKDGFFFDTYISLTIYDCKDNYSHNIKTMQDINVLLDTCVEMCADYEKIFSHTLDTSELYKLNNNVDFYNGNAIRISDSLYECIEKTLQYSTCFGDKYSILSGNLCSLWDYTTASIPEEKNISDVLNFMNEYKLHLDDKSIMLEATNISDGSVPPKLNLGSTAKGYIADKLCTYLTSNNIHDAIIDLGGNIVVIGDKYDNSMYKIGIKKPFSEDNTPYVICKVADKSVVTSGIYERYFEVNDIIYHHIIDCSTGYPTDNDILSVTIISNNSLLADCYSTGCLLLGSDAALTLINSTKEVECVIINKDYQVILSDGLMYEDNYITLK